LSASEFSRRGAACLLAAAPLISRAAWADAAFSTFVETLWPLARDKSVRRATFDAAMAGLAPDPTLPKNSGGQPEFDRPLQAYFQEAVSPGRIARGRREAEALGDTLRRGEQRFGVPGEICLAAWAMESDFGRARGSRDIIRSLATQAYTRRDRPLFRDELIEALIILDGGAIDRARLTGSWAGAMGDPQFLPSAYRKYAVTADGGAGSPDIWTSPPDILASIANFLAQSGWRADRPWAKEVLLPETFAFPALRASLPDWTAWGVRPAAGAMPGDGEATLFLPSGAAGPAFLLFENYWIIKQYNNSDSYALSFGALAGRIAGGPGLVRPWPRQVPNLSRADKAYIQERLATLGFYKGAGDGKFGPTSREAIHEYQKSTGFAPADGFATPALVARLRGG
jgi:lytic murein transglycosylase